MVHGEGIISPIDNPDSLTSSTVCPVGLLSWARLHVGRHCHAWIWGGALDLLSLNPVHILWALRAYPIQTYFYSNLVVTLSKFSSIRVRNEAHLCSKYGFTDSNVSIIRALLAVQWVIRFCL